MKTVADIGADGRTDRQPPITEVNKKIGKPYNAALTAYSSFEFIFWIIPFWGKGCPQGIDGGTVGQGNGMSP